jgi:hypothetical protein
VFPPFGIHPTKRVVCGNGRCRAFQDAECLIARTLARPVGARSFAAASGDAPIGPFGEGFVSKQKAAGSFLTIVNNLCGGADGAERVYNDAGGAEMGN